MPCGGALKVERLGSWGSVRLFKPSNAGAELPSMHGAENVPPCTPPLVRGIASGSITSVLHHIVLLSQLLQLSGAAQGVSGFFYPATANQVAKLTIGPSHGRMVAATHGAPLKSPTK